VKVWEILERKQNQKEKKERFTITQILTVVGFGLKERTKD
jgi:hypothetical protein